MARSFLALWLPYFATDRLGRTTDPLVTLTEQAGVPRVTAANKAALQLGIVTGMALADARALHPALSTRQANPLREQRSLTRLADWCGRYSPSVAFDGTDGLMIDITGCDHLFGGQAAMLGDLTARIEGLGYTTTAAIAPTPGAAWALARYAAPETVVSDPACLPDCLAPLPLAALRLQPETVAMLAQVGLRQIGDLLNLPRAPLAKRFGAQTNQRLAQALGHSAEAIAPRHPPSPYRLRLDWMEPLQRAEDLTAAAEHLLHQLCQQLEKDRCGIRHLTVGCYGTDGHTHWAAAHTSAPCRRPAQLLRLLEADLTACDMGFGIETMILSVAHKEKLEAVSSNLWQARTDMTENTAALTDQLNRRFSERRVGWSRPVASYIPERASAFLPALHYPCPGVNEAPKHAYASASSSSRPLRILPAPESMSVTALLPDYPPAAFYWRKESYRIKKGNTAERITPEWWNDPSLNAEDPSLGKDTRDYYLTESNSGKRFWLYRKGLYDHEQHYNREADSASDPPAWFLHGMMA